MTVGETGPGKSLSFVGAGALGQAFAALLARSGQAATLLATPGTAAHLLTAGVIRLRGVVERECIASRFTKQLLVKGCLARADV